jgi:hypothetical protein
MGLCSGSAPTTDAPAKAVKLLPGYGAATWKIRTPSADAQAFFDNGLQLGHAFAHKSAVAAFEEAARRDPNCAMCLWGQAWAGGATINYTVDDKVQADMAELMKRAEVLAADGSPLEKALIAAMKARYEHGGGKGPGDAAYAKAMDAPGSRPSGRRRAVGAGGRRPDGSGLAGRGQAEPSPRGRAAGGLVEAGAGKRGGHPLLHPRHRDERLHRPRRALGRQAAGRWPRRPATSCTCPRTPTTGSAATRTR